jgi:hypothetical protein
MNLSRLNKMSNQQLLVFIVGLLVVFGLVSAVMFAPDPGGGCCSGNMVVNKNRHAFNNFTLTYWMIDKYSDYNDIYNASDTPINYTVKVTELETKNSTLVLHGTVSIKHTGSTGKKSQTAYLANVVVNLRTKGKGWSNIAATDVLTYDNGATSVNTCETPGTFSEGIGSGELSFTDALGNDPFAGGLYAIEPNNKFYWFNYSASFNLDELNLPANEDFREELILTFINSSKTTGAGTCSGIDADGDGNLDTYVQSEGDFGKDAGCGNNPQKPKCPVVPVGISTNVINITDAISTPASSIVTIPEFTIDTNGTLNSDGTNEYMKTITYSDVPGTVTTIKLNSTATCNSDGVTLIRNNANITAADMSVISGDSEAYAQINFACGDVEPPQPIGEYCTFTQASYGGLNKTGYEVMKANATFPFVVGNNGGPYTLTLTNYSNTQEFLPQNGTPSFLTTSLTDPGKPTYPLNWSTSARQFAGEVVALHLNVKISDDGGMPQNSTGKFGDRTVNDTSTSLHGKPVRVVLGIANCLLANGTDCSGYTTTHIPMVNSVVWTLNRNYLDCENDFNNTGPEDNTPPVINSVEATPDLLAPNGYYDLLVNVTDDFSVDSVDIEVDGSPYSLNPNLTVTDFWYYNNLQAPGSEGTYTITVNASDGSGNWVVDTSESIVVDATDPVITINPPPANDSVITAGTIIDFSVTDANLEAVKVNISPGSSAGSTLVDFASPYDVNTTGWDDDLYTIYIYANDSVGNDKEKTYQFTIDSTDPTATLSATPDETNNDENVTFTALVTDDNYDSENVYLNCKNGETFSEKMSCSGSESPYTCTYEWDPVNDGDYSCNVTATDLAGNSGTSSPIQVIIDSQAPVISLNDPEEDSYIQAGTQINISVTNGVHDDLEDVWYSTDGGASNSTPLSDSTDPLYYMPTTGLECEITFDVWASDSAGNVGHENFTFNIDKNDPVINSVTVSVPSPFYPSMLYNVSVNATDTKKMDLVNVTVNGVNYTLTHSAGTDIYYKNGLVAPAPGTYTVNVTKRI